MIQAPDYAEALLAWRIWRVARAGDGFALTSIIQRTAWPAGRSLTAECLRCPSLLARLRRRPRHEAPETRCECGIYGASLEQVSPYLAETPRTGVGRVLGLVSLWGTVVECERGYRASCAYPARIYVPVDASNDPDFDALTIAAGLERYGVPTELVEADCRRALRQLAAHRAAPAA